MRTELCELLDLEFPILAFSHCRDVVAAVSRAGGMGILGAARFTAEELDTELDWIDRHVGGRPYGVDIIVPARSVGNDIDELAREVPDGHRQFVAQLMAELHIPAPKEPAVRSQFADAAKHTRPRAKELLDVALAHPPGLLATALGPLPPDWVGRIHAAGRQIAGLVGDPRHVAKHVSSGTDILVAVGTEAGGHTGDVSTMVLVPQIVDAAGGRPVLAAGGIGSGRQMAAALALGAQGVWTGSVWLLTNESDVDPVVRDKLLRATSHDTVRSKSVSGKPVRVLRTAWTDAWDRSDAPQPLEMPMQQILVRDALIGIYEHRVEAAMGSPVGQIVGQLSKTQSATQVVYDMVEECAAATSRLADLMRTSP